MEIVKNYIDVGLQTNQREEMLAFWGETIGLPFEELLKVGGGTHQLRHNLNNSVFKLNHVRAPLSKSGPTGYKSLLIAKPNIDEVMQFTDPDGNQVSLVPTGYKGITHLGIEMEVSSLTKFQHFYKNILNLEQISDAQFRWGTTDLFLFEQPGHRYCDSMTGLGYRYLTVQVRKVDTEHAAILAKGGTQGSAPTTLGKTARISFIRDPDGNFIEISQRASLTGDLSAN